MADAAEELLSGYSTRKELAPPFGRRPTAAEETTWRRVGPAVFTRGWCLLESMMALSRGCQLHVCLCNDDARSWASSLDAEEISGVLASMDARHAQVGSLEGTSLVSIGSPSSIGR